MSARELACHPVDQSAHAGHVVGTDIGEPHLGEGIIQKVFSVASRVHEIGSFNPVPCPLPQIIPQSLHLAKGPGLIFLQGNGCVTKGGFTEGIK